MTSAIKNHLDQGELDQAIAAMNADVRQHPTDIERRGMLAELLCFAGNLERADAILDSINALDSKAAVGVALFRQLVRAEQARQQFYSDGRLPEFLKKPEGAIELELRASIALRENRGKDAADLLAQAEACRPAVSGKLDGASFDDFRDLDDGCAAHVEVLTSNGKYYWIPVANIQEIEFRKRERRRDLLWPRALMSVFDGPDGEVFLPAIYAPLTGDVGGRYRLGLATDFMTASEGLHLGIGLRSFLIGEEAKTIHELGRLEFDRR